MQAAGRRTLKDLLECHSAKGSELDLYLHLVLDLRSFSKEHFFYLNCLWRHFKLSGRRNSFHTAEDFLPCSLTFSLTTATLYNTNARTHMQNNSWPQQDNHLAWPVRLESWNLKGVKCEQGEYHGDKHNLTALQEKLYIYLQRHRESQILRGGAGSLHGDCLLQHRTTSPSSSDEGGAAQRTVEKSCPTGIYRPLSLLID